MNAGAAIRSTAGIIAQTVPAVHRPAVSGATDSGDLPRRPPPRSPRRFHLPDGVDSGACGVVRGDRLYDARTCEQRPRGRQAGSLCYA